MEREGVHSRKGRGTRKKRGEVIVDCIKPRVRGKVSLSSPRMRTSIFSLQNLYLYKMANFERLLFSSNMEDSDMHAPVGILKSIISMVRTVSLT